MPLGRAGEGSTRSDRSGRAVASGNCGSIGVTDSAGALP